MNSNNALLVKSIEFYSSKKRDKNLRKSIESAIAKVLNDGNYIKGKFLEDFEHNFSRYVGAKYAVGVGNGYDGLRSSLLALEIKPGDEVIFPVHTYSATWMSILSVGASPIGCDIDLDSGNMLVTDFENKITKKTRAIIVVHMHGTPADIVKIVNIARKHNLKIIEDCAQAHGAKFLGQHVGTFGDLGVFSFYPTKNLGGLGDGGIVVSNSKILKTKINQLGNYGRNERNKQKFEILGYNSRLDSIQAAVLNEFLPYLDKWNDVRKSIAMKYKKSLLENNNFEFIPRDSYSTNSVWHHFVVLVKHRPKFIKYMKAKGVNTDIHYEIPSHRQPSFPVNKNKKLIFPNADKIYKEMVSLPMHPWLEDKEVIYISKVLRNYKN